MELFALPVPGQPNTMGAAVFLAFSLFMLMGIWMVVPHILGLFSFVDDMNGGRQGFIFILVCLAFYVGLKYF